MANIIAGMNYSLLFGIGTSGADPYTAILSALYSGNTGGINSTAVSTGNPLTDLTLAQQNQTKAVAAEAKDPAVARDIAAFKQGIANAGNIDAALTNPNVLKVLLTANGLASQVQYPGLAKKVLLSDPTDTNSLVNKLASNTWLNTVKTYNFAKTGLTALQDPKILATLTDAYMQIAWRQSLDKATPGLSNALAFMQQASSIKTADDILGDPVNRAVVTTALGIPQEIAFQSQGAQENAIAAHLDIKKLQDPKFVVTLTDQYLLNMQQQSQPAADSDLNTLAAQARGIVI